MINHIQTPAVLTIAGSDSGGGAGIQADLRTFSAFKVYGCSAITAVTSQNPNEVRRVDILPAEAVKSQIETVLAAVPIKFAKTGMLANQEIIEYVSKTVAQYKFKLVVDPVMVSTSGVRLLAESAIEAIKSQLFPLAEWITPNIPEAELLCGKKISSPEHLAELAVMLYEQYKCNIILKSGHLLNGSRADDVICYRGKLFILSSPQLAIHGNTAHGTGCTLSAALAANLALNKSWETAIISAKAFVYGSLLENVRLSNQLCQMYPPQTVYNNKITLNKLNKN